MKEQYYVAYGSNLHRTQLFMRCPESQVVATGYLKNYELLFRGTDGNCFCTVEKKQGSTVPISINLVSERDKLALDRYEGYPRHYRIARLKPSDIIITNGNIKGCKELFMYVMNKYMGELGHPSNRYYNIVYQGYHDCGLNPQFLQRALQESINRMPQKKPRYTDFWPR